MPSAKNSLLPAPLANSSYHLFITVMISLQMLLEPEEQENLTVSGLYAGWGRAGSFSCAKAS